jgi:hypothetical protein
LTSGLDRGKKIAFLVNNKGDLTGKEYAEREECKRLNFKESRPRSLAHPDAGKMPAPQKSVCGPWKNVCRHEEGECNSPVRLRRYRVSTAWVALIGMQKVISRPRAVWPIEKERERV